MQNGWLSSKINSRRVLDNIPNFLKHSKKLKYIPPIFWTFKNYTGPKRRMVLGVGERAGKPGVLQSMGLQSQTQLSDWTTTDESNVCVYMCVCVCVCVCVSHSAMSDSVTPWTVACQALSVGFFRQEYWSGLPFPSPGELPRDQTQVFSIADKFFTIWGTFGSINT